MTQMEVTFGYGTAPTEAVMRALDSLREVYGIRRIIFNTKLTNVKVEYDASRFKEVVLESLLRRAGLDLQNKSALA